MTGKSTPPRSGHVWTLGNNSSSSLTEHLRAVLTVSGNSALGAYSSPEADQQLWAAVSSGLAVETVLKLAIASKNEVLIADSRSKSDHAVMLANASTSSFSPSALRTVNGLDAFSLYRNLYAAVRTSAIGKECEQVFAVRNAAVHMGLLSLTDLRLAIRNMVILVNEVLESTGIDREEIWSTEHEVLIETLLDSKSSEVDRSLAEKKTVAFRQFQRLVEGIPSVRRRDVIRSIERPFGRTEDSDVRVTFECPVCNSNGVLTRYVTRSDLNFSGASYPNDYPSGVRYAYPEEFACYVCGLILDSEELELDTSFDEVLEVEVEPSAEFDEALAEWKYESKREYEREFEL